MDLHYPAGQCCEATDLLHLENVVVVNLHWLDFAEDAFDSLIKGRKLKVLTLVHNRSIHGTPTFPKYSVLERLTIYGCCHLMEIDCSIGNLRWLTDLSVESCAALRKLPEQIGELRKLRHLSLMSCQNLVELPDSVSKLVSLTMLDVSCTRITRLPDSISSLPYPSSLDVSFTLIAGMPSTMSKFLHLQRLYMDRCNWIRELPMLPTSLTVLWLRSTLLFTIPNLSYLTNLVELLLSDDTETTRTSNVFQTCDLRWIGRLSKLSKLHFCFLNGCAPATELDSLSLLKELTLYGLDLQTLEQLPSNSLEKVTVKRNDFKTLAIPSNLTKRKESKGDDCHEQFEDKTLGAFKSMKRPRIEDCKFLEGLVCQSEELRHNEQQASQLTYGWRGAFLIPSSLNMLREFHLSKCPEVRDIQFVSALESLEEFSVSRCISLKRLGGLSKVKNLKQLHIEWCENLQVVEGIYKLKFLHKLKIHECRSMRRIFDALRSKIPKECSIEIS
ncbi:hypothetical protein BT93_G0721 [Corymbia citriodora subsp. variegata]|nr:hypothetical protein BT93_G0721 [Corymbia citriodora subsp. variegata]